MPLLDALALLPRLAAVKARCSLAEWPLKYFDSLACRRRTKYLSCSGRLGLASALILRGMPKLDFLPDGSIPEPKTDNRVGGEPCGSRPPSEPCVKVSPHTAQALTKESPFRDIRRPVPSSVIAPSCRSLQRHGLCSDIGCRLFVS